MAKPQESYPETATNGNEAREQADDGEAALRAVLAEGDSAIDTDELSDILTTAILIAASADETEIDHITESTANLIEAADGLTTAETAELAHEVGANADELSATLETVLELERDGHLDDLVTITTAFSGALSPSEITDLATMLDENGSELVETLDILLDLQREEHLEDLIDIVKPLSALEVEQETVEGLNTVLGAVGETQTQVQRESHPDGLVAMLTALWSRDARAGLGYVISLLKALGRRVRTQ